MRSWRWTSRSCRAGVERGRDRHGPARPHRHAGPAAGQASDRAALPRRGRRARRRGLQLPAGRRRRDEHRSTATRCPPGSAATATSCMRPDLATLRSVPWQRGDRARASPTWRGPTAATCVASPRQILRAPARAPGRARLDRERGRPSSSSSSSATATRTRGARATATSSRPTSTTSTTRCWARRASSR